MNSNGNISVELEKKDGRLVNVIDYPVMLNPLASALHQVAKDKGWYDNGDRNIGELIALIHSELSEALEEARNKKFETYYPDPILGKPEGFAIEIADVLIRILDMCAYLKIDIEKALQEKINYNATRTHRHGGKYF